MRRPPRPGARRVGTGGQATASEIVIPYEPRSIFTPFHRRAERFACVVAHRRCGKTVSSLNDMIRRAVSNPLPAGRYAFVAPYLAQAKEVAWEYLKHYTRPLLKKPPNESELYVDLMGGARIRIHGADNPERLRGPYLDGVVMDEFADMRPSVWPEIIRPMLADRSGWAVFIGTPKGRNEFYQLYRWALEHPDWYAALWKASVTNVLPPGEIAAMTQDMTAEQIEQELECSFEAAILGAYYGKEMAKAEEVGRIGKVAVEWDFPVHTAWDLGKGQNMPIWVFQIIAGDVRVVDYLQSYDATIERLCADLNDKHYHGTDWVPQDAKVPDISTGRTRVETMFKCGRKPAVVPDHKVDDGINAVKLMFPRVYFDEGNCAEGMEALRQYKADFDEKLKTFKDVPRHDWASHPADAFRYLAMAWREPKKPEPEKPKGPVYKPLEELTYDEYDDAGKDDRLERI